ncbi:MAG: rhodanese-like domain-containing protein [Bacteroidetes bacterium]|nr:MAG: rhodanese-like domain-containing protein [Bacteroidota bacterium]TAG89730.1 MAG: rhodanese-like domain-containing protein [Bacteroidota bacterium]
MDINADELKERIAKNESLHIIDVREEWEYEEQNIGAMLIPLASLPQKLQEIEAWKSQEIIVHCRSGARSSQAQKYLQSQGFQHVRNLTGGIIKFLEKV